MITGFKAPHGTASGHHAGASPDSDASGAPAQTNGAALFADFGWDSSAQDTGQFGAQAFGPDTVAQSFLTSVSTQFLWSPGAPGLMPWGGAVPVLSAGSQTVVVSTPGSGLVFDNTFGSSCTAQYEACAVAAEKQLESLFTNSVTINETFNESNGGDNGDALSNSFYYYTYTYAQVKAALLKVAPNDVLPATDPSGGAGWEIPVAYARMLGLTTYTETVDDTVTLNTYYGWQYGQDVINGITHELTEGGLGRIGALGGSGSGNWSTMDLFRYNAAGQADYSNGRDGQTTYFSADGGSSLSDSNLPNKGAPTLSYNNQYTSSGTQANTGDTADWVQNNVFGSTGDGETLALTQTELEVMQALGWHLSLSQDVESSTGPWETPTSWSTGSMPIEAQDAYITAGEVTLDSNVLVNSIATSAGSNLVIGDSASSTLTAVDGTTLNSDDVSSTATGNLGEIVVCTGSALQVGYFDTTFDNAGTILLGKGAGSSGYASLDIASSVSLTGGGTITLGTTGTAGDILNAPGLPGSSLANVDNTLSGGGVISLGGFDNQLDGVVEAQSYLQITAGTFTNEGLIIAEANATLDIGQDGGTQSLAETGSILIDAGAHLAISGNTSISGTGAIGFKGAGGTIGSDGTPATFTNAGNIDAEYNGQIGDADLTFDNTGTTGTDVSGVTLTINTGSNTVTNTGTLAAENGGTLAIVSNLNNSGVLEAGISSSSPDGTVDLGADGGTGTATDNGSIDIYGGGDLAISGNYTIAGGAATQFKGAGAAITSDGNAPATFTNASIIEAFFSGQIGDVGIKSANDLTFTNTGTVVANTEFESTTTLTLNTGANTINDSGGLIEAEGGATIVIDSAVNTGTSGTIEAESGTVTVNAAVSGSGTLSSGIDTGSLLDLAGGGSFAGLITGIGTVDIESATTLLAGASLSAANVIETGNLTLSSVAITNSAGNTFTIDAGFGATVALAASGSGSSFTNAGNLVIDGAGTARITAPLIDSGAISVTSGSLQIEGPFSGTGALSIGAGTSVSITTGGTLTEAISGAGTLQLVGAYTLSGEDVTVGTLGVHTSLSGSGTLAGALIDSGTVASAGGSLLVGGKVSGAGTLSAGAGTTLGLAGGGSFAGAITGAGTVAISGATTLSAGAKLSAAHVVESANVTLASVALTNALGDVFAITAASAGTVTLASTGTGKFTNAGSLVINGAGTARINAPLIDSGAIAVTSGSLQIVGPFSGTGALSIGTGTSVSITDGGALTEAISGAGTLQLVGAYTLSGADVKVATLGVHTSLSGHGTLAGALIDSGTVASSGGTLLVSGKISSAGTLSAGAGTVLDLKGGGSFAGAISGAGTVAIAGATTLTAGAKLAAATVADTANLTFASVAVTNTAGDIFDLTVASGGTVTVGSTGTGAFTNAGNLVANGAGTANITGPFTNSGTVSALSGTLSIHDDVAGTGTMDLGAAGTLSLALGASSGQSIDFLGKTGVLDLSNPLDFAGTINDFGSSDQIFLANTSFTTFGYSSDILTVKDGSATVANLKITESSNLFTLTSENHGVLITF